MPEQIVNFNSDGSVDIHIGGSEIATQQAGNIIVEQLPEWLNLFLRKNRQYKHLAEATLGDRAMFVDVWRKVNALKLVIWDGEVEAGTEPPDEIILDLIGHLFLMLEYRAREVNEVVDRVMSEQIKDGDGNVVAEREINIAGEGMFRLNSEGKYEPL